MLERKVLLDGGRILVEPKSLHVVLLLLTRPVQKQSGITLVKVCTSVAINKGNW